MKPGHEVTQNYIRKTPKPDRISINVILYPHSTILWKWNKPQRHGLFGENRSFSDIVSATYTLMLDVHYDIGFVAFVLSHIRSVRFHSCCDFRSLRFRIISHTEHLSAVVCHLAYCRVGAKSAPRYIQINARVQFMARFISVLPAEVPSQPQ